MIGCLTAPSAFLWPRRGRRRAYWAPTYEWLVRIADVAASSSAQSSHLEPFAGLPGASFAGGLAVAGALAGQLLCTIHGVQRRTAEVIIAEISIDMSIFATAKQLTSSSHVVAWPPRAGRATRRP
jgi:hypothetical protein